MQKKEGNKLSSKIPRHKLPAWLIVWVFPPIDHVLQVSRYNYRKLRALYKHSVL